jgi:hypothetical protein
MSDTVISPPPAAAWPLVARALHWIDTSLACNWLLVPLSTALLTGYLNIGDRVGIGHAAKEAHPTTIQGTLDRGGRRARQLWLTTSDKKRMPISCGAEYVATRCIPDSEVRRLPLRVTLDVFQYRGDDVLLSASDGGGRVIVGRPFRQWQLNGLDENARGSGWGQTFIFGLLLGLIIAAVRYVFFVRGRRRRQMTGGNINAGQ